MRIVIKVLAGVIALLAALVVGAFVFVSDANRIKPELESLIAEYADIQVNIQGDLSWSLWPPVSLRANDVTAVREDLTVTARALRLELDLRAIWQDVNNWQLKALELVDATIDQVDAQTRLSQLTLADFQPGKPAALALEGTYQAHEPDAIPITGTLQGQVLYAPGEGGATDQLTLRDAVFESAEAAGQCDVDATQRSATPTPTTTPETDEDLLPVALLRSVNLVAECQLSKLVLDGQTFANSVLQVANMEEQLNIYLEIKDFLEGKLIVNTDVDLSRTPIVWVVTPEVEHVSTAALMAWSQQRARWVAPLAAHGTIQMKGNTPKQLLDSVSAQSQFDGGQGQLDISMIKQQLLQVAALAQRTDKIAAWPDMLNYQEFTGDWQIEGKKQALNLVLDNVRIEAAGDYDYFSDDVDMLANVIVSKAPEASPIEINPLLEDTPIPVRCIGPSAGIKCKLDQDAAQKVIASALTGDGDSGLRRKLEKKIEEDVPEEYRETARGLLDILGKALNKE